MYDNTNIENFHGFFTTELKKHQYNMNNLFIPVICFYKHPLPAVPAVFIRSSFILPRAAPKPHF